MLIADDVVFNPKESPQVPARTERSLSKMGLSVQRADWGDSVAGAETRQITLELAVREDAEVNLPTAAHELQQLVGSAQERGTWIRRDPKVGGPFAGSVMYRVKASPDGKPPEITLSNLGGWQAGASSAVVLTIVAEARALNTTETQQAALAALTANYFIYEGTPSQGSDEGLRRVHIDNLSAADWRGLIWSEECWDLSTAATAQPVFEAQKLTPKGSTITEVGGVKVVQSPTLTTGWQAILGTYVAGTGHMTHRGGRRPWMRVYNPGAAGNLQFKLVWRVLGSARWVEENAVATVKTKEGWQWIDLDSVRPQVAALGGERWEGKVMARVKTGTSLTWIHLFAPLSTEQYLMLQDSTEAAIDGEPVKAPATLEDSAGVGTVAWANPAQATEPAHSEGARVLLAAGAGSHYLKATNLGLPVPEGGQPLGVFVNAFVAAGPSNFIVDSRVRLVVGGVVKEAGDQKSAKPWINEGEQRTYGGPGNLWGQTSLSRTDVVASGFGVAIAVVNNGSVSVGASIQGLMVGVQYAEGGNENRICFASRAVELRSDGCYRQHITDDVWGRIIQIGRNPYSPPGGLEGRPVRGVLIPTQGDLEGRADVGTNKAAITVYERAGHKIARESN